MTLDFDNLQSYTTEELEAAQKRLYQELRRRSQEERQRLEELKKLAFFHDLTITRKKCGGKVVFYLNPLKEIDNEVENPRTGGIVDN